MNKNNFIFIENKKNQKNNKKNIVEKKIFYQIY
jgi:hypothetical protein